MIWCVSCLCLQIRRIMNFQRVACSPFWMQAAKTPHFLKLSIKTLHCSWIFFCVCALQIKINVEKERMIQVKNITWKPMRGMWTEVYLVYYPTWQHWAPAAFTNSRAPSETHGEIICPGALACISNTVMDWFKSRNKTFSVFPIVFINSDKAIELTAAALFYWENVTAVNLPNSGWHFLLCGSPGEESPGTLGIEGITSECLPVQIAVGKKVKLQRSPGKLIFPNCISWQETQILEVPVEIIQYLNSD